MLSHSYLTLSNIFNGAFHVTPVVIVHQNFLTVHNCFQVFIRFSYIMTTPAQISISHISQSQIISAATLWFMWDLKSQRAFSCASYTGPFPRSTLFLTLVISEFFFSAQSQEISVCLGWKWALWVFSHILQNPGVLNFPHVYGGPLWSWVSCSPPAPSWSQTSDLCQYRIFSLTGVPCLSHRHRWLSLQSSPRESLPCPSPSGNCLNCLSFALRLAVVNLKVKSYILFGGNFYKLKPKRHHLK